MSTSAGEARAFFEAALTIETDECIVWPYSVSQRGYGRVRDGRRPREVHRLMCEIAHGPCPPGMETAHGPCHDRRCFNPAHLSWQTAAQNAHDRLRDGTAKNGGPLTAADASAIREMYATGAWTQTALAAEFGVAIPTINHVVRRRRWKDVA